MNGKLNWVPPPEQRNEYGLVLEMTSQDRLDLIQLLIHARAHMFDHYLSLEGNYKRLKTVADNLSIILGVSAGPDDAR